MLFGRTDTWLIPIEKALEAIKRYVRWCSISPRLRLGIEHYPLRNHSLRLRVLTTLLWLGLTWNNIYSSTHRTDLHLHRWEFGPLSREAQLFIASTTCGSVVLFALAAKPGLQCHGALFWGITCTHGLEPAIYGYPVSPFPANYWSNSQQAGTFTTRPAPPLRAPAFCWVPLVILQDSLTTFGWLFNSSEKKPSPNRHKI